MQKVYFSLKYIDKKLYIKINEKIPDYYIYIIQFSVFSVNDAF